MILGDTHYNSKERFRGVKFLCKFPPPKKSKTRREADVDVLTKKQKLFNERLGKLRARVEHPFGIMEKKFKALSTPFMDGKDQLDNLVFFAAGVLNSSKY